MAVAYHDPSKADDTGDGLSWANAKKTWNAADVVATSGGTVKHRGQQLTTIGGAAATWTIDSANVVVAGDVTATCGAGDWIYADGLADCPAYRVASSSYSAPNTTIVLEAAFRLASGSYSIKKCVAYILGAGETTGATNITHTFGWNSGTDTQDADYETVYTATSAISLVTVDDAGTHVYAGDATKATRLRLLVPYAANYVCLAITTDARVSGTLDASGGSSTYKGAVAIGTTGKVQYIDTVLCSRGAWAIYSAYPGAHIKRVCAHNCSSNSINSIYGNLVVDELLELGCAQSTWVGSGVLKIGRHYIRQNGGTSPYSRTDGFTEIGYLDVNQAIVPTGPSFVGGPIARWKYNTSDGAVTKVTGRGGTGLGRRIDPASKSRPAYSDPLIFLVDAADVGLGLTLNFWAYYSGTGGGGTHTPECWVELLEPNGLTVAQYSFTPPNGSSFTDATQMTIAFAGTLAQAGSLQAVICCVDNSDGDAVLYVDPKKDTDNTTWTVD